MRWRRKKASPRLSDSARERGAALIAEAEKLDEDFRLTGRESSARDAAQRWLDLGDLFPQGDALQAGAWHEAGVRYLEAYSSAAVPADLSIARQLLSDAVEATPENEPNTKGLRLANLGSALRAAFEGTEDLADLDQAQSVLERAVSLLGSATGAVSERQSTRMMLAQVLRERYRVGGDLPSLERALALDDVALLAASSPEMRSQALNGIANSLAFLWHAREDRGDLDRLVATREQMLELVTPGSPRYATAVGNLANAYSDRALATGSKEDCDRAVQRSEEALALAVPASPLYPAAMNNLVSVLRGRYDVLGDVADLERALELSESAMALCRTGGDLWLSVANNFGTGLRQRFLRQGSLGDLERAVQVLTEVAGRTPPHSPEAGSRWHNLGNAMRARYLRSRDPADLEATVNAYERGLSHVGTGPQAASLLSDLGSAYNDRYVDGAASRNRQDERDLDRARACYERAEQLTTEETPLWRSVRSNQGRVILDDPRRRADLPALDEAASAFLAAIERTPPLTPELLIYKINLAETELLRYEVSGDAEALERRRALLKEVTEAGVEVAPDQGLLAASSWGQSSMERQQWQEAAMAYHAGLRCLRILCDRQSRRDQKETWLQHAVRMAPRAAYCLARLGEVAEAIEAVEAGRGVLLAEALERRDFLQTVASADAAETDLDAVVAAAAIPASAGGSAGSSALVFLVSGPGDGRALIVGMDGLLKAEVLPGFGEAEVLDGLLRYQAAYDRQQEDSDNWRNTLEDVTSWLWTAGIGHLCLTLGTDKATLVPTGALSLLPLHAAWRPHGDESVAGDGRRYAMEDTLLTYAPNARMLRRSREVPPLRERDGVLVVADPRPSTAPMLPHAAEEGARVRRLFQDGLELSGLAATRTAVWEAIVDWPVLHFACHAYADPAEPLMSNLVLAGDEPIHVRDVLQNAQIRARLVVLSACETAVVGEQLPDELVGLPTAFLQAGASGVVGTWWPVYDESTAELMERFHIELRQRLDDPAEALRQAQLQVRAMPRFRHPVHWAGVSYMGG